MRSVIRYALGIAALVQVTVVVPTASGQAVDQHACSLFQPSDLLRITGRKDIGGRGPQASKPGELRTGTTECNFLNISMTLTQNMTPAWFARNRKMSEDAPDRWKVQSIAGLGDEAYYMWDPRPGSARNMGLVFRAGSKQMAIGQLAAADSIESSKPMLMQIARLLLPKMKWPPGTWTTSLAQVAPSHPCLLDPRPNTPLEGQRMLGRAFPAELEDRPTDR